jgi:hypothetical protein
MVKLTIHLQLVCRLRISAATSSRDMYRDNFTLIFITHVIKMVRSVHNVTSSCSGSKTFWRLYFNGTGMCCALLCPLILRACCWCCTLHIFANKLLSFYACACFLTCQHINNFMLLYLIVPCCFTVSETVTDRRTPSGHPQPRPLSLWVPLFQFRYDTSLPGSTAALHTDVPYLSR